MVYYSGYWQTQKHSTAHCMCISACSMTSFPWTESVKYWCLDVGIYYVAISFLSWLCFDIYVVCFLICFPMKYWDFSVKSKPILPLVVTSEITIFIFTVSKNGLFMNSGLKVLSKGLKYSILVRNYGEDVNVPYSSLTALTYCFFCTRCQADYHWLRHFVYADVLRFIALNAIWPHFLGTKLCFYPILCPQNTLNKTKLTRNG